MDRQWILVISVAAALLGASEWGLRAGRRLYAARDDARRSQVGGVQGAVLGLLGLLLGFTFAMAVARQDTRRSLVVQEANAIGTTWLRADLLPPAHLAPVREQLRRYVDVRIRYRDRASDPEALREANTLSAEIHQQVWATATAAAQESPTPMVASFITSLNEMIDTDTERMAAHRNHIPSSVWVLVVIVAAFGCFTSAYGSGSHGARSNFTSFFLPLLITIVIGLIYDLDHSLEGIISVSQQPLLDLRAAMAREPLPPGS